MKAKEDEVTRARFNAECLRTKVATMTHQIRALREDQAEGIASAVEDKMENFLEVLADSLNPDERRYSTSTIGTSGTSVGSAIQLPPSGYSKNQIMGWVHQRKRSQGLDHRDHPKITNPDVQDALCWMIRLFQDEQNGRSGEGDAGEYSE